MIIRSFRVYGATPDQRKIIRAVVPWGLERLIGSRMAAQISIKVKVIKDLHDLGTIEVLDDYFNPRTFLIELNAEQPEKDLIESVLHELVHAKQYLNGELQDYKRHRMIRWGSDMVDPSVIEYYSQPWEVEAFRESKKLSRRYMIEGYRLLY
jgi:hypothetical protein